MMFRATVVIIAALATSAATSLRAETLTLCGQKLDYQPRVSTTASPNAGNLVGVWVGEIIAFNAAYSVDYSRCWALAIEDVSLDGAIKSKLVLADNTRNMHNGTRYGTQGSVRPWVGKLEKNGATLNFTSINGGTSYELQHQGTAKMEGKVAYPNGTGRVFLTRQ